MLSCNWCQQRFVDGENITFRCDHETEVPYHTECFKKWFAEQSGLYKTFGRQFVCKDSWFNRTYRDSQIVENAVVGVK